MDLIGEGFWCWGSLRSWQILHSRLAEGSSVTDIDLWQLMDEARNETERYEHYDRNYDEDEGEEYGDSETENEEEEGDVENADHRQQRNNEEEEEEDSYISAKFREWIAIRQQEEEAIMRSYIHNIRSESRVFYDYDNVDQLAESVVINDDNDSVINDVNNLNNLQSELADYGDIDHIVYRSSQEGDDINNNNNADYITETETISTSTTLSNYNREAGVGAETRYCSSSHSQEVISEKARSKSKSNTEEIICDNDEGSYYNYNYNYNYYDDEICPICLDKLHLMIDEKWQGISRLACTHSFHSDCLSPWLALQRSDDVSRCCPCCRAPVQFLAVDGASSADIYDHHQPVDIMGLLADMEAALDRFGLLA